MVFQILLFVWTFAMDVAEVSRLTDEAKDLEILLLRQQLRIVERKQQRGPQIPRWQKIPLAVLVMRLKDKVKGKHEYLEKSVQLFKPETIIGWHRELVRRKWNFKRGRQLGRPRIDDEIESWIVRLAMENHQLGCEKLEGELRKLGLKVSATTIRTVLRRHNIPPLRDRARQGRSWRVFLTHYKEQFLAYDFFTVETLLLQTIYVLFFIEHGTRRVYVAGCTTHPNTAWVTQQTRQTTWKLQERELPMRYLIHDHDTKFTQAFDAVFKAEGVGIVDTPFHALNANAIAERWVRSVREECLDHLIILNEHHLRRVLTD